MGIQINLCINRIFTNWRGNKLNAAYAVFCMLVLIINIIAIAKSLYCKLLRKRDSVRLFIMTFCGNICTICATFSMTVLRMKSMFSCSKLQALYILYQFGMGLSSYALLILIYVNFFLTKKKVLLTKDEKKELKRKILYCSIVVIVLNVLLPIFPVVFPKCYEAFSPAMLSQVMVDMMSVIYSIKLSKAFKKLFFQVTNPVDPIYTAKAKESCKLILPVVIISNMFKFVHYTLNVINKYQTNNSMFYVLAHLQTIYFIVFLIVPCFYLYSKRKIN